MEEEERYEKDKKRRMKQNWSLNRLKVWNCMVESEKKSGVLLTYPVYYSSFIFFNGMISSPAYFNIYQTFYFIFLSFVVSFLVIYL